jgi:hypothetical protein
LRTYENKDELKNEINKSFAKYISELTELQQKILLTRLAGQLLFLNGNQTKERVFMSRLLRMILSGISLANYTNGSQIHMRICRCRS